MTWTPYLPYIYSIAKGSMAIATSDRWRCHDTPRLMGVAGRHRSFPGGNTISLRHLVMTNLGPSSYHPFIILPGSCGRLVASQITCGSLGPKAPGKRKTKSLEVLGLPIYIYIFIYLRIYIYRLVYSHGLYSWFIVMVYMIMVYDHGLYDHGLSSWFIVMVFWLYETTFFWIVMVYHHPKGSSFQWWLG